MKVVVDRFSCMCGFLCQSPDALASVNMSLQLLTRIARDFGTVSHALLSLVSALAFLLLHFLFKI